MSDYYSAQVNFLQASQTAPPRDQIAGVSPAAAETLSPEVLISGDLVVLLSGSYAEAAGPESIPVEGDASIPVIPGAAETDSDVWSYIAEAIVEIFPDASVADTPPTVSVIVPVSVEPGAAVAGSPSIDISAYITSVPVSAGNAEADFGSVSAFVVSPPEIKTVPIISVHDRQLMFFDAPQVMWAMTAQSGAGFSAETFGLLSVLLPDSFRAQESLGPGWALTTRLASTLDFKDFSHRIRTAVAEIAEALDLNVLSAAQLVTLVREALRVRVELLGAASLHADTDDSVKLADQAILSWLGALIDTLNADAAATPRFGAQLSETVNMAGAISKKGAYNSVASDLFKMTDQIAMALLALAEDVLSMTGELSFLAYATGSLFEQMGLSGEMIASRRQHLTADEVIGLAESLFAQGSYGVAIADAFRMDVHVVFADEDGEIWECFALNTANFQPSVYTRFAFNSFCTYAGRTYAAGKDGIYEIAGDTDEGAEIPTGAIFSQTNFNANNRKRFRKAYLGVSGSTPVVAMATEDGAGIIYEIQDNSQVHATRSLVGRKWTLTVADFDELDFISLVPVVLARGR